MSKISPGSSIFRNMPTGCEGAGREKEDISGRQDSMYRGMEGKEHAPIS